MNNINMDCKDNLVVDNQYFEYYSLRKLAAKFESNLQRLPVSLRIILESVLRNCDDVTIESHHVLDLLNWQVTAERKQEIPFMVSRVLLQDFTGVPLLCDLAAMRDAASQYCNPDVIEPLVPVDLVVDHSIQVDEYGTDTAIMHNMELEFKRNHERYQFLKWGMQAFNMFRVVPPGIGIVHQVNLEYLFRGVHVKGNIVYPDTLVGTDSHTTMINSLGVVGWGVGGIEAEAAMLGQPVYILMPDVVGFELTGQLNPGVTATDLVLTITEILRSAKVVGKFVEFYGSGVDKLTLTDRATVANMAPEYGATMGFFPVDDKTVEYMRYTGKSDHEIKLFIEYFKAQGLFGIPLHGEIDYSHNIALDLSEVEPSVAGPSRPQDRITLRALKKKFYDLLSSNNGFNKFTTMNEQYAAGKFTINHGDVLIAAITSCTNTSNPAVLIAAGLLAKKAVELGLTVNAKVKTSLAPGSRVVTEYLKRSGLQKYLSILGFNVVGYGCTTCIGNSGPLDADIQASITSNDVIACAVLSGNRNFEARIHSAIKANFLASPPLVVAFALAGRIIDLTTEPFPGTNVFLKDIWPSDKEVAELMPFAYDGELYNSLYNNFTRDHKLWNDISAISGTSYSWPNSTYIARPPFFDSFTLQPTAIKPILSARALLILGDSVTTDHISPAGLFNTNTPSGKYLLGHGVRSIDFNSYGSRRGNHEVMVRGTFANVRIKNLMLNGREGGFTINVLSKQEMDIYTAATDYIENNISTVIFAGEEYGTGSSRDWAAKGTMLLGVRAVIARSFERIHRSNLIGMGVLPLQFMHDDSITSLGITVDDVFDIDIGNLTPGCNIELRITRGNQVITVPLLCRIDTAIEVQYYQHGGIMPFVLRKILKQVT